MKNKIKLVVAIMAAFLVLSTGSVAAYTIDNTYQLGRNEGSSQRTNNRIIIAHDTGTYAPAINNAIYMKRTWNTNYAYTQYVVGDGGKVFRVGADGYVSWGAGSWGNANAPVQVELARTNNQAQFKKDYATYVALLRDSARKFGISTNLDTGYGIVTHKWITDNVWGDHVDPYGYLASHGISKAQFAKDLKNGIQTQKAIQINYVKGYGIAIWSSPLYNKKRVQGTRTLKHGTSWKYFGKDTVNGRVWYHLGGDQWIDGQYAKEL